MVKFIAYTERASLYLIATRIRIHIYTYISLFERDSVVLMFATSTRRNMVVRGSREIWIRIKEIGFFEDAEVE